MGKGSRNRNGRPEPAPARGKESEVQQQTIAINTEITRQSKKTMARRTEEGGLLLEFLVMCEGEYQIHRYACGEEGKQSIMDAATGGLAMPGDSPVPPDLRGEEQPAT